MMNYNLVRVVADLKAYSVLFGHAFSLLVDFERWIETFTQFRLFFCDFTVDFE